MRTRKLSSSTSNRTNRTGNAISILKDRVALQCYHNEELWVKGETSMPDQSIVFDEKRVPKDTRPGQDIRKGGF